MKKILLKSAACLLLMAGLASCSTESAIDLTQDTTESVPDRQSRSTVWDGVIGEDRGTEYAITADEEALLADLQANIYKEGSTATLVTLDIVKKRALNDLNDEGYILIATDGLGTSIGTMLSRNAMGIFKLDPGLSAPKTVSCRGCASGCNLEYLYIDGKKVPICNENGCIADCTKSETELN